MIQSAAGERERTAPAISIAHRGGNSHAALRTAIEHGAAWIEADIWWHYGRLEARHEHAIWHLPIRYDEWTVQLALHRPLTLPEICRLTAGGPNLLIDFKGSSRSLPEGVVAVLRAHDAIRRAAICGQNWVLLDAARTLEPSLPAFYSIGSERQITALRSRAPELPSVKGVSCADKLLTPELICELNRRQIAILAWTVNERQRALDLADSGVQGIISDSSEVLSALRA